MYRDSDYDMDQEFIGRVRDTIAWAEMMGNSISVSIDYDFSESERGEAQKIADQIANGEM